MSKTAQLLALAEAATQGPWNAGGYLGQCFTAGDATFIAAANPETIKQLVELVRLQHETLLELEPYIPANVVAIEAFNKWENWK